MANLHNLFKLQKNNVTCYTYSVPLVCSIMVKNNHQKNALTLTACMQVANDLVAMNIKRWNPKGNCLDTAIVNAERTTDVCVIALAHLIFCQMS